MRYRSEMILSVAVIMVALVSSTPVLSLTAECAPLCLRNATPHWKVV